MAGVQNLLPISPKRIIQENQNINLILIKMDYNNKIPTAKEFLWKKYQRSMDRDDLKCVIPDLIEFAKLHVTYIQSLQMEKYYAGETGYITREEWEEILNNIK